MSSFAWFTLILWITYTNQLLNIVSHHVFAIWSSVFKIQYIPVEALASQSTPLCSLNLSKWVSRIWTLWDILQPNFTVIYYQVSTSFSFQLCDSPGSPKLFHAAFSILVSFLGKFLQPIVQWRYWLWLLSQTA